MNKKSLYFIGFFVVLILVFWAALYAFTDTFNQSRLEKKAYVQPFAFKKEDGSTFTNANTAGKVYVVEYFFTTCLGICPKMNTNMKKIYEEFKDEPNFLILSHTCNPETDSVPQLKRYADSLGVNTNKWIFLTGRKDSLYKIARFSYGIDDPKNIVNNIADDFMHSQFFALVDKNGIVRGQVYDGLKEEDLNKLKKDIRDLLKEKDLGRNFSNGMFK
jgi:protein SCO1/2